MCVFAWNMYAPWSATAKTTRKIESKKNENAATQKAAWNNYGFNNLSHTRDSIQQNGTKIQLFPLSGLFFFFFFCRVYSFRVGFIFQNILWFSCMHSTCSLAGKYFQTKREPHILYWISTKTTTTSKKLRLGMRMIKCSVTFSVWLALYCSFSFFFPQTDDVLLAQAQHHESQRCNKWIHLRILFCRFSFVYSHFGRITKQERNWNCFPKWIISSGKKCQ